VLALTLRGGQKLKDRQMKIYAFDRDSILEGVISSDNIEDKLVTLPDCFFVQAYEGYTNSPLDNGAFIDGVIKIVLSHKNWLNRIRRIIDRLH